MGNCLVTQLKGSVNENLPKLGEITFLNYGNSASFQITIVSGTYERAHSDGTMTLNGNIISETDSFNSGVIVVTGGSYLTLSDKYGLTQVYLDSHASIDLAELNYLGNGTGEILLKESSTSKFIGDVSSLNTFGDGSITINTNFIGGTTTKDFTAYKKFKMVSDVYMSTYTLPTTLSGTANPLSQIAGASTYLKSLTFQSGHTNVRLNLNDFASFNFNNFWTRGAIVYGAYEVGLAGSIGLGSIDFVYKNTNPLDDLFDILHTAGKRTTLDCYVGAGNVIDGVTYSTRTHLNISFTNDGWSVSAA